MLTSFMEHTVKMPFLLFEMFDIIWQRLTMCASALFRAPDGQICHIKKMCLPNMCNHFMRDTWTVWNATMVESGQDKRKRKTPGSFIAPKYRSLSFFLVPLHSHFSWHDTEVSELRVWFLRCLHRDQTWQVCFLKGAEAASYQNCCCLRTV